MEISNHVDTNSHLPPNPLQRQQQQQQQQQQQHRQTLSPLPFWARFYFYGMHGLLDEIVFTALFDLVFEPEGNRQLKGYSTLSSFFIYGSCSFVMESCFIYCTKRGYPVSVRLAMYVLAAYLWEFTSGLVLRQLGACSWDYSHYPLNLLGLVTLVYAPGWLFLGLLQDYMYRYLFSLHVVKGKFLKAN
ncbi:transmembrane protein 229A-like [Babylonia areolata]|uniref:transmembrane protein 229A-like n=1 Tax=Babylonia areolata TaxID=304850 RepID=UPI003FD11CA6